MSRKYTLLLVATLALMMAAPVYGNSQGPPWMHNDRIVPEEGCSCHGAGGSPSSEIILSISGVPRVYDTGDTYNLSLIHI